MNLSKLKKLVMFFPAIFYALVGIILIIGIPYDYPNYVSVILDGFIILGIGAVWVGNEFREMKIDNIFEEIKAKKSP